MNALLVTGGTGTLGRAVVRTLEGGGHEIRMLSRKPGPPDEAAPSRRMVGDLRTGKGVASAVEGVRAVVHCATTYGRGDVAAARSLVAAARGTGDGPHLVYVSIVGVDAIPLPYYRAKLAAERVIAASGLPWTVLRTTQFHDLIATVFALQRRMPLTLALKRFRFQPIDTRDVAARLAELATGTPAGRAPDIGGPQVATMDELARIYSRVRGPRRRVVSVPAPGRIARGFAEGRNLVPQRRFGTVSFEDFLAEPTGETR